MLRFVTGRPALVAAGALVIGDLHLGLEHSLAAGGIRIPDQTGRTFRRIRELLEDTGCKELIILGDIKNTVAGAPETPEVVRFVEGLERSVKVTLVQGNHDGTLRNHFPDMKPASGFRRRDVYFMHGHAAPDKSAFGCSHIIMSHLHPVLEFRDSLGGRISERVWLRCRLRRSKAELIVVPAFNDLMGGADVRGNFLGPCKKARGFFEGSEKPKAFLHPMKKFIDRASAGVFLLDGTPLGNLNDL
jgi:putative SbcD/Mre11-related phosphoesterase